MRVEYRPNPCSSPQSAARPQNWGKNKQTHPSQSIILSSNTSNIFFISCPFQKIFIAMGVPTEALQRQRRKKRPSLSLEHLTLLYFQTLYLPHFLSILSNLKSYECVNGSFTKLFELHPQYSNVQRSWTPKHKLSCFNCYHGTLVPFTSKGHIWTDLSDLGGIGCAKWRATTSLLGALKATEGCLQIHAYFSDRPSYLIGFPSTRHQRDGVQGVASESKNALIQKPPEHRSPRQHNEPIYQVHDSSQWSDSKMKTDGKKGCTTTIKDNLHSSWEAQQHLRPKGRGIFLRDQILLNFAHDSCSRNLLRCLLRVWRSSVFFSSASAPVGFFGGGWPIFATWRIFLPKKEKKLWFVGIFFRHFSSEN